VQTYFMCFFASDHRNKTFSKWSFVIENWIMIPFSD
jgi:hypothetical protein